MKMALCSLVVVFVVSCGTENKDKPGNGSGHAPEQGHEDGEAKYFQFMESCDTNSGKAVIDGKCVTFRISATLDGKLTLASSESGKAIFEGGVGIAPKHEFPFTKYKRENTTNNFSYAIKKQSSKVGERSISIDTTLEAPNDVSSVLYVLADRSEARVELEVFGERFSPEEQDRASLNKLCDRIGNAFKEKHPLANDATTYGLVSVFGSYSCLVGNRRDNVDGLEDFKRIKLWWACKGDRCYFESLFLNGF